MRSSSTGQSYDLIADRWQSPGLQSNGIEAHKRALTFANRKDGRALDIGCGSSGRFIELLTEHGFHIEGLDVSARMIELAKQRHPTVMFHHDDVRSWPFPHPYDFITAWDSIWHVPLSDQAAVLKKIAEQLAPGGVFIFTMGGLDHPAEHTDSSMGPALSYATLGIPDTLEVLSQNGCVCRHLEYDQPPEPHLFVIAQKS